MIKFRLSFRILVLTAFTLAFAAAAQAQATRTWVSGVGDDANPCSRTAPCKTFAGAISKTFINGEIDCLDPGGFGTVTITKSITIDGGSGFGSILASGTNGVNINILAGNANDPNRRVTLRRLSINGTGASGSVGTATGIRGINISTNGAKQVNVENCYIQNFTTVGIDAALTETGSAITVRDTNISNTAIGIQLNTTTGFVLGVFDNVRIDKMTTGINSKDRSFMTVRNSFISSCTTAGIAVVAPSNSNGLNVESTVLYSVGTGIAAGGAGTKVDISNTSILDNTNPATSSGATLNSHGNNQIANNTNVGAAFTPVGQQ
jgi:hypothetical protein